MEDDIGYRLNPAYLEARFGAIEFLFKMLIWRLPEAIREAVAQDITERLADLDEVVRQRDTDVDRDRASAFHDFLSPIRDEIL